MSIGQLCSCSANRFLAFGTVVRRLAGAKHLTSVTSAKSRFAEVVAIDSVLGCEYFTVWGVQGALNLCLEEEIKENTGQHEIDGHERGETGVCVTGCVSLGCESIGAVHSM